MEHINESFIVGVDFGDNDQGVLIVGKQTEKGIDVINAVAGKEAYELYLKLITKKA